MCKIRLFVCILTIISTLLIAPLIVFAGDYIIGEGDSLAISVWGVDRLNFSVKVRPDGIITVPGLGEIHASGLRPRELQSELTEKLKELVKNPIVSVTVNDITNSRVYIFGGGIKSVIYELNRKSSLLQILCSLSDIKSADLSKAYLLRNGTKIKEDFSKLFIYGDIKEDIAMESNDALFIPLRQVKCVYVLGAVNSPKSIDFREGMTVLEAILEAGGFSKFANQNKTIVVRKEKGKENRIPVRAGDLLENGDLRQNILLQYGDYIIAAEGLF